MRRSIVSVALHVVIGSPMLLGSLACKQKEPEIEVDDYPVRMAAGYCEAVYSCQCDPYPYDDVNECFAELLSDYDVLNDQSYLAGLAYDGTCPAAELTTIDQLACRGSVPVLPEGVCVAPCNVWHGQLPAGYPCQVLASSDSLGIAFSNCGQGLVCVADVCINPCQSGVPLPGIGEPCPAAVCAAGAVCDAVMMICVAEPTLPGAGQPCLDGVCDPDVAVCVAAANTCAALPGLGQPCIEGQCNAETYCEDSTCVARPPLACGLLGADDIPNGDGDGDPTTGDGDGDTGDGDGDTGDGDGDAGLSYAADIQPVWDDNCVTSCHEAGGFAEFLDLSADSYANVVGMFSEQATDLLLVAPGSSANSYLINKLRGTQVSVGGDGNQMPGGLEPVPLPEATIATIEQWIDGGALP